MILHCFRCSAQGTRLSRFSELAKIDVKKLRLPLTLEMFSDPWPERRKGVPPTWRLPFKWYQWNCWHGGPPWGADRQAKFDEARKKGGPDKIFTDEGWVYIDETGIVKIDRESKRRKTVSERKQLELERDWKENAEKEPKLTLAEERQVQINQAFAEDIEQEEVVELEPEGTVVEQLTKEPEIPVKKKYVCDQCGKSFDYAVALAGHKRSHKKKEL
jgi:hypothetical protein